MNIQKSINVHVGMVLNTCPGYVLAMLKTCVTHKETWHSEFFMNDYARKMRR